MGCPGFSSYCFTEIDVPVDLRWVSQGISGLLKRMSSHLLYMMWNERRLCIQWRGNVLHLELIWGTPSILPSGGDISVLLVFLQSCWGLSRVQSSKSRLLMCLIGKMQLLCMQCRGIGPHLVARGKSHGFTRVAAGTWGIFSSYDGDAHSKREFV